MTDEELMLRFKQFLEENKILDLYRRYSTGINTHLISGKDNSGDFSFLKNYDTSGKGAHEYEHHNKEKILKNLDSKTTDKNNALEKKTISYSGVSSNLGSKIHNMNHGHIFKTPAYLSSSHDVNIAHKFAEKDNNGQNHIMQFHLPVGYYKSKSIPNAREGGKSKTDERLFARNQNFKHIKTEKQGSTYFHHYTPE